MNTGQENTHCRDLLVWSFAPALLVAISYIPILFIPPVSDDYYFLSSKFANEPWRYLWSDLFPDDPETDFLRPLPALLFVIEGRFPTLAPALSHAVSLLIHLLNVSLIALLMQNAENEHIWRRVATLFACLFFGLHPQVTGAVCWISARFDLCCLLFGVLGFKLWIVERNGLGRRSAPAFFFLVCAVFSKETGILFPIALLIIEVAGPLRKHGDGDFQNHAPRLLFLAGFILVYVCFRIVCLEGIGGYFNLSAKNYYWQSLIGYFLVMVWPFHTLAPLPWPWLFFVKTVLTGFFCVSVARSIWHTQPETIELRDKWQCLCVALLICVFSLTLMGLLPLTVRQILEHAESRNSYISIFFFSVILGYFIARIGSIRWRRFFVMVLIPIILIPFLWAQQVEISRWQAAGIRARSIIDQTVRLIPKPEEGQVILFTGIPMVSEKYYYVFGMGLEEALQERYENRTIKVVQWPSKAMLKNPPDNSIRLDYSYEENSLTMGASG